MLVLAFAFGLLGLMALTFTSTRPQPLDDTLAVNWLRILGWLSIAGVALSLGYILFV